MRAWTRVGKRIVAALGMEKAGRHDGGGTMRQMPKRSASGRIDCSGLSEARVGWGAAVLPALREGGSWGRWRGAPR